MTYGAQKQLSRLGTPGFHNTSTSCSGGSWSVSFNMNNSAGTFAEGSLRVNAQQTDQAGNQGSAQRVGVKDTVAPTVSISAEPVSPSQGRSCASGTSPDRTSVRCNTTTNTPAITIISSAGVVFDSNLANNLFINFAPSIGSAPPPISLCYGGSGETNYFSSPCAFRNPPDPTHITLQFKPVAQRGVGPYNPYRDINGTWSLPLDFIKDVAGNVVSRYGVVNVTNLPPSIY